ncbi:MAG: FG-GAP-like repeat-containing protein [Acidobacteriota bacterium]
MNGTNAARRNRRVVAAVVAAIVCAGVGLGVFVWIRRSGLPSPGSPAYEETVRSFYRGLASLQVGLLDDAKREFTRTTELVPREPAAWADLGLTHLRLGDFDPALQAIERAASLASSNSDIVLLRGQLESSRGRLERAIADFRRAVELNPENLRARFALAQEVERAAGPDADAEAQQLIEELLTRRPDNLPVLVERTRLAVKRADARALQDSVTRLAQSVDTWPAVAAEQFRDLERAGTASNFTAAAPAIARLRNVLVRVPSFREGFAEVRTSAELIGEPFAAFLRLTPPSPAPSPPDRALSFARESIGTAAPAQPAALTAFSPNGSDSPAVFAIDATGVRRLDAPGPPFSASGLAPSGALAADVAPIDWNRDYRMDLAIAGRGGIRLLVQSSDGTFTDATAAASGSAPLNADCFGVWAVDLEMDGDLDLVAGLIDGAPVVLRNNGDTTWRILRPFAGVVGLRAFASADLDGDGDADAALLDAAGRVHVFENRQAGQFSEMPAPDGLGSALALTLGDINADGVLDLVTLGADGLLRRTSARAPAGQRPWQQTQIAAWTDRPQGGAPGAYRVFLADLDNNGALDVVASGAALVRVWLGDAAGAFQALTAVPDADVTGVLDLNGDGLLDLIGLAGGNPVRLVARSAAGYHWQVVWLRAQPTAGDQRINSFGIGGDIEIRSGLLTQKQAISGLPVHFGLGTRSGVDVTRIVWPNGVMQADFDRRADQPIVAEQRLKGSCPWIFADDGTGLRFVTDFLWRSPLGLRVNAQDTAGVTQTEDRVKIRGDQLAARDGTYDVRITAELWETHFIDHVSLLVVDHPADTEVFVDERFARSAPALTTQAMRPPQPVAQAWDEAGRDVTDLVKRQDGRYLSTFALGEFQGIAADHFVEIDLGQEITRQSRRWLVASGWIYPTDSSINVAIGQGQRVQPRGLSLEALDKSGRWVVVAPDLGFPAGKNKTILIDLRQVAAAGVAPARRLRLRTNLEVYWDRLAVADAVDGAELDIVPLLPARADLRYRGFSQTDYSNRRRPEIPVYGTIANVTPRWRDLVGYYTRFGDVGELLGVVDDRYVIMNAGDELKLSFRAPAPPAAGSLRDFVLVGDGWVKDGDYNTTFSKTVGPLPRHDRPDYEAYPAGEVEDDPVYRRYPRDWETYHTRFVTPGGFLGGLR